MKSKKTVTTMLKLQGVKVGKLSVYLEESEGTIRIGASGRGAFPLDTVAAMSKSERRKLRKSLARNGHHDIVKQTLFENQMSRKDWNEQMRRDLGDLYDDDDNDADDYLDPGTGDFGRLKDNYFSHRGNGLNYATDGDANR